MTTAAVRINRTLTLLILLFVPLQGEEAVAFFVPPKDWKAADPSFFPSTVKAGFLAPAKTPLCPSLNFVQEPTTLSFSEYVQTVRTLHMSDRSNRWRLLGPLYTRAGKAILTEIDTETPLGKIRILQSILVKDQMAYILTGAMPQESFSSLQKSFLDSFRSLFITQDFIQSITTPHKQALFAEQNKLFSSGSISVEQLQKILSEEFAEEGLYWQMIALKKLTTP